MSSGHSYQDNKRDMVFICPFCGVQHEAATVELNDEQYRAIVLCSCDKFFELEINGRKYSRTRTCREGMYKKLTPPLVTDTMHVIDISLGGCRFDASISHHLQVGDRIALALNVGNAKGQVVKKEAIVKNVAGRYIGCEFIQDPMEHDRDLASYLRATE